LDCWRETNIYRCFKFIITRNINFISFLNVRLRIIDWFIWLVRLNCIILIIVFFFFILLLKLLYPFNYFIHLLFFLLHLIENNRYCFCVNSIMNGFLCISQ
jgi:hypothetical protein